MIHVRLPPLFGRPHVPPSPAARGPGWGLNNSPQASRGFGGGEAIGAAPQMKMQAYEVDTQFYNYGVALMADSSRSEDSDSILTVSPDLKQNLIRGDVGM